MPHVNGRRLNILFVLLQLSTGGTEKMVLTLAKHLDRSLFKIYIAFFNDGQLRQEFERISDGIFHIPKKKGLAMGTLMTLSRIIRENSIDVVNPQHYASFFYSWLASALAGGRRIVYTEHSVPEVEKIPSLHRMLCRSTFFRTTAIVGVSEEVTGTFTRIFPACRHRIYCIQNGVDVSEFAVRPMDRAETRVSLGMNKNDFVIGTVANFRFVKNHLCLLRAMRRLTQAHPRIRLLLVGTGYDGDPENSETAIRNFVSTHGLTQYVLFTGYRKDIPDILRSLDLFCLPSFSEGLPVSILEAMAARIPVIGSDVRGIKEVILQGNTGLLFPSDDDSRLAAVIERLVTDDRLRERLREKAFRFVNDKHGIADWVTTYEALFMGGGSHGPF